MHYLINIIANFKAVRSCIAYCTVADHANIQLSWPIITYVRDLSYQALLACPGFFLAERVLLSIQSMLVVG